MFIRKILCLLSVLFIIGAYSTETKAAPIDNQDGTITQKETIRHMVTAQGSCGSRMSIQLEHLDIQTILIILPVK